MDLGNRKWYHRSAGVKTTDKKSQIIFFKIKLKKSNKKGTTPGSDKKLWSQIYLGRIKRGEMAASFINLSNHRSASTGQLENSPKIKWKTSIRVNYLVWINFPTGLFVPPRPIYCVVNFRTGYIPHGNTVPGTVWIVFPTHSKTMFCHQITRFLWHWRLWENINICIDFCSHFGINFQRVRNNSLLKRMVCNLYYDVVTYGIFSDIERSFLFWQKSVLSISWWRSWENSLPQNRFWAHKDS